MGKSPQHGCFDVGSTLQRHGLHHGLHWQGSTCHIIAAI